MRRSAERLQAWAQTRRDGAVVWARNEHNTRTGFRKRIAAALLENAEILAQGHSLGHVHGQRRASRAIAIVGSIFALGSFASFAGYIATALGCIVFGTTAITARLVGNRELAHTARRMTALMAMATIPIVGNAFSALFLASELNALKMGT